MDFYDEFAYISHHCKFNNKHEDYLDKTDLPSVNNI